MIFRGPFKRSLQNEIKKYDRFLLSCVYDPTIREYTIATKGIYRFKDGTSVYITSCQADLMRKMKTIVSTTEECIKIAFFGFYCPLCGTYVAKGSNYIQLEGLNICMQPHDQIN